MVLFIKRTSIGLMTLFLFAFGSVDRIYSNTTQRENPKSTPSETQEVKEDENNQEHLDDEGLEKILENAEKNTEKTAEPLPNKKLDKDKNQKR